MRLEKIDDYRWLIPRTYKPGMLTDAVVFANERLLEAIRKDQSLEQAANVTMLPGIVGRALAMPDIHQGYGFPIGGVAAVDAQRFLAGRGSADAVAKGVERGVECGHRRSISGKRVCPACTCSRPYSAQRCSVGTALPGFSRPCGSNAALMR